MKVKMEYFEKCGRRIAEIVKDIEKLMDQYDIQLKNEILNKKIKGEVKRNGSNNRNFLCIENEFNVYFKEAWYYAKEINGKKVALIQCGLKS